MSEKKKSETEGDLEARAAEIGRKASHVAREVLEGTFDIVETVLLEGANVASKVAERASDLGRPGPAKSDAGTKPSVLGWQRVVMNVNAVCDTCNAVCARGAEAAIGVTDRPSARRPVICLGCLDAIRSDER